MTAATTDDNGGRNRRGQFSTGNRYASGNPVAKRMGELRRLVENIGDDDVQQVVGRLVTMAKGGDVQAAGLLLNYCCGKPRPAPVVLELDLPRLDDASSIAEALRAVTAAVAGGELDLEAGAQVVALVERVGTATCWADLERRVAAIEAGR